MRCYGVIGVCWLFVVLGRILAPNSIVAQVRDEEEFVDFLSSIQADFYTYEDSINQQFADYLEQSWQEFTVYEGIEPPVYADGASCSQSAAETPWQTDETFFGCSLRFPAVVDEQLSLPGLSEKEVAEGWRRLVSENFTSFFKTYIGYSQQLCLNDWGNYQLLKYAARKRYGSLGTYEQTLFLFYLLSQAGYRAKIGRAGNDTLVLLLPFEEEVYKLPFIRVGGNKYYIMDLSSRSFKKLYSIRSDFPKSDRTLSLQINEALNFPIDRVERRFTGKYPCSFSLNRNLLHFYATLPLCDLSVYFNASLSHEFIDVMDQEVKSQLKGKQPSEQMAWLLDFVQQMFSHKPDVEVHAKEVYYFPEETAYYPYADCEDLSVFLSWLVLRYVTDQVLILYYPTHVALAVERYEGYEGDLFTYRDKEYLICDPSYRGSLPGKVIPACASLKPVIVSYVKQRD